MRLVNITVSDRPPIKNFSVSDLTDVVVIAGPNGVGKTNILNFLLNKFRGPSANPSIQIIVEATSESEKNTWKNLARLNTATPQEAGILQQFVQRSQKRGQLRSGVINFDSSRVFENIQPYSFSWNFADPFLEDVGWEMTFNSARQRFQDVVHALYRKVRSQKEEIASTALKLQREGSREMRLEFADPLEKFKDSFAKLLPGKVLCELDEQRQQLSYTTDGATLPLDSLSSGEREVVTIVFDFLLRDPQDSIIVFDEPELHLHPELSYRLLRTLRDAGERNQFIFCTHSADIISASLDHSVVFIGPPKGSSDNQAIKVSEEHESARVLHLLGQSVGVISLGRRIVLIEGIDSSLDKQTYGSILGSSANDLVLVPTGGRDTITSFLAAVESVLDKTIWGIEFFMLCDGDATVGRSGLKDHPRLRRLSRYHLENYFLDEGLLARVLGVAGESENSPLRDPRQIKEILKGFAQSRISHAVAIRVSDTVRTQAGNVDLLPKNCHNLDLPALQSAFEERAHLEQERWLTLINNKKLKEMLEKEFTEITQALSSEGDEWKKWIPGKILLKQFAATVKIDVSKLKTVYIREAKNYEPDPFTEIKEIFGYFSQLGK
ncbi:MAG TPA: ATP-binding protein [Candidatus Binatia bacterium]|nr:ATP-binding protein [Candidatus Binatia bacterium]